MSLELAEQNQNREMLPAIRVMLAQGAYNSADLLLASLQFSDLMKPLGSAQVRAAAELLPTDLWATAGGYLAIFHRVLGRPEEALRLSDEALRRARQLKHSFELALAIQLGGNICLFRREPEAARELAEEVIALAEEYGFQDRLPFGRALRGWAMTELDQMEEGVAELEAAAASSPLIQVILLEVYASIGRADKVIAIVDQELAELNVRGHASESRDFIGSGAKRS